MWIPGKQKYNYLVWSVEKEEVLKKVLIEEMGISLRMISELKSRRAVNVNGTLRFNHEPVHVGEIITVDLGENRSEYGLEEGVVDVIYEDEDIVAVNKSPFIVVHPTGTHLTGTLLNYMESWFRQNGILEKVRFISRLDRDTSGILLIAKNRYAHHRMSQAHQDMMMQKTYVALIEGKMKRQEGEINAPIGRRENDGIKREVMEDGQTAITKYKVLKEGEKFSLVELTPVTGRTHQLRCHMAYIGYPLIGDSLYGGNMEYMNRQALHSVTLEFFSPRKEEKIYLKAELPQDMQELVNRL
ncbi:pseudouridine synthase, RluA family [Filifactor alocis ATCC 35896]|jgi:pseudouridine synthase, RluA family|uniref:Pseudouridine synthase n=1 Tax=Filifactor alocis (strain ATCC 35896 / CCUG 47790 / D40 B5) TaxID=546269 RepID=D6GR30_FILAD|nr:RluA family pseudouridine synthase [Filifactor alocis]EFE28121.1 pseudouridine synthase, RluA family [Filifactor alocis ATCC 35896]